MFWLRRRVLGIHIGMRSMEVVELERNRPQPRLSTYRITTFDLATRRSLNPSQLDVESLARLLKSGLEGCRANETICVLPTSFAYTTTFSLPNLPPASLPEAVVLEAQRYLPINSEEMISEFRATVYPASRTTASRSWLVFFTAIPKTIVAKLEAATQLNNLRLLKTTTPWLATEGLIDKNNRPGLVLNLDFHETTITFLSSDQLVTGLPLRFSFQAIVEQVANLLGLSFERALALVEKDGLRAPRETPKLGELFEAHRQAMWFEIERTARAFESNWLSFPTNLFVTGQMFNLPGFSDWFVTPPVDYRVVSLNPFTSLTDVPKSDLVLSRGFICATAVGAARLVL